MQSPQAPEPSRAAAADAPANPQQPGGESPLAEYQYAVGPEQDVPRKAPAFTGEKSKLEFPPEPPPQFSLGQMLAAMVVVALLMAPAQFMSAAAYAGLIGVITLTFLGLAALCQLRGAMVLVAFLMLLAAYVTAASMAAFF